MKNILKKLDFVFFNKVPMILQSEVAECSLACVNMILNYYGDKKDILYLRNLFKISSQGLNLEQLQKIIEKLKFESRAVSLKLNELNLLNKPYIVHWKFNHFVVLTKIKGKYVYINDPAFGRRKINISEFSNNFTGIALEIFPSIDFKPKQENIPKITLKDIVRNLYKIKNPILKILSLSILIEIVTLFLPLAIQILTDHVIKSNDLQLLIIICSVLFFSNIFKSILSLIRNWITIKMNAIISIQWQINFFVKLLKIPIEFFEKRHLGDIKSKLDSLNNIYSTIISSINTFTINLIVLIFVTIAMCLININLLLLVVLFSLIYFTVRMITYIKFKQINEELIYKQIQLDNNFIESIYSIYTIKSLNLNNTRKDHWIFLLINLTNTSIQNKKYSSFFTLIDSFISIIDEIIVLFAGIYMIMNNIITIGMFIAFNAYRVIFTENIFTIINDVISLKILSIHYNRISDVTLSEVEQDNNKTFDSPKYNNKFILEIKNINYRYDDFTNPILNNISFNIEKNDNIAIIGSSGCGKTTLLKIMSGLLYPCMGEIIFNGTNIKQIGYVNYRDNIALVLQEDHLFAGSLLMNIACFSKNIDINWVMECARIANIHNDIINMPMGYETIIGHLGTGLSTGQKQRIFIARAIYKKPQIIFLDEYTSNLDIENEKFVNEAIKDLNITKILVSHRKSVINSAKKIIDLNNF